MKVARKALVSFVLIVLISSLSAKKDQHHKIKNTEERKKEHHVLMFFNSTKHNSTQKNAFLKSAIPSKNDVFLMNNDQEEMNNNESGTEPSDPTDEAFDDEREKAQIEPEVQADGGINDTNAGVYEDLSDETMDVVEDQALDENVENEIEEGRLANYTNSNSTDGNDLMKVTNNDSKYEMVRKKDVVHKEQVQEKNQESLAKTAVEENDAIKQDMRKLMENETKTAVEKDNRENGKVNGTLEQTKFIDNEKQNKTEDQNELSDSTEMKDVNQDKDQNSKLTEKMEEKDTASIETEMNSKNKNQHFTQLIENTESEGNNSEVNNDTDETNRGKKIQNIVENEDQNSIGENEDNNTETVVDDQDNSDVDAKNQIKENADPRLENSAGQQESNIEQNQNPEKKKSTNEENTEHMNAEVENSDLSTDDENRKGRTEENGVRRMLNVLHNSTNGVHLLDASSKILKRSNQHHAQNNQTDNIGSIRLSDFNNKVTYIEDELDNKKTGVQVNELKLTTKRGMSIKHLVIPDSSQVMFVEKVLENDDHVVKGKHNVYVEHLLSNLSESIGADGKRKKEQYKKYALKNITGNEIREIKVDKYPKGSIIWFTENRKNKTEDAHEDAQSYHIDQKDTGIDQKDVGIDQKDAEINQKEIGSYHIDPSLSADSDAAISERMSNASQVNSVDETKSSEVEDGTTKQNVTTQQRHFLSKDNTNQAAGAPENYAFYDQTVEALNKTLVKCLNCSKVPDTFQERLAKTLASLNPPHLLESPNRQNISSSFLNKSKGGKGETLCSGKNNTLKQMLDEWHWSELVPSFNYESVNKVNIGFMVDGSFNDQELPIMQRFVYNLILLFKRGSYISLATLGDSLKTWFDFQSFATSMEIREKVTSLTPQKLTGSLKLGSSVMEFSSAFDHIQPNTRKKIMFLLLRHQTSPLDENKILQAAKEKCAANDIKIFIAAFGVWPSTSQLELLTDDSHTAIMPNDLALTNQRSGALIGGNPVKCETIISAISNRLKLLMGTDSVSDDKLTARSPKEWYYREWDWRHHIPALKYDAIGRANVFFLVDGTDSSTIVFTQHLIYNYARMFQLTSATFSVVTYGSKHYHVVHWKRFTSDLELKKTCASIPYIKSTSRDTLHSLEFMYTVMTRHRQRGIPTLLFFMASATSSPSKPLSTVGKKFRNAGIRVWAVGVSAVSSAALQEEVNGVAYSSEQQFTGPPGQLVGSFKSVLTWLYSFVGRARGTSLVKAGTSSQQSILKTWKWGGSSGSKSGGSSSTGISGSLSGSSGSSGSLTGSASSSGGGASLNYGYLSAANIGILIDGTFKDTALVKRLVFNLISAYTLANTHVTIMVYTNKVYRATDFAQFRSSADVKKAVNLLPTMKGGERRTGAALWAMVNAFTMAPPGQPNIVYLLSGGSSSDNVYHPALRLRRFGIKVFAASVNGGTPRDELVKTAYSTSTMFFTHSSKDILNMITSMVSTASRVVGRTSKSDQSNRLSVSWKSLLQSWRWLSYGSSFAYQSLGMAKVAFLIDSGGDAYRFDTLQKLAYNTFKMFAQYSQLSLVSYAGSVDKRLQAFRQYTDDTSLQTVCSMLNYQGGGGRRTGGAFMSVVNFFPKRESWWKFWKTKKRDNAKKVLILVTTGRSDDDVTSAVKQLSRRDVTLVTVGIGETVNAEELNDISKSNSIATDWEGLLGNMEKLQSILGKVVGLNKNAKKTVGFLSTEDTQERSSNKLPLAVPPCEGNLIYSTAAKNLQLKWDWRFITKDIKYSKLKGSNVVLIVDVSKHDNINAIRRFLYNLVQLFTSTDTTFTLITFGASTEEVFSSRAFSSDGHIRRSLEKLQGIDGGQANGAQALSYFREVVLDKITLASSLKRTMVFYLARAPSRDDVIKEAQQLKIPGITIATMGIGSEFNVEELSSIATTGQLVIRSSIADLPAALVSLQYLIAPYTNGLPFSPLLSQATISPAMPIRYCSQIFKDTSSSSSSNAGGSSSASSSSSANSAASSSSNANSVTGGDNSGEQSNTANNMASPTSSSTTNDPSSPTVPTKTTLVPSSKPTSKPGQTTPSGKSTTEKKTTPVGPAPCGGTATSGCPNNPSPDDPNNSGCGQSTGCPPDATTNSAESPLTTDLNSPDATSCGHPEGGCAADQQNMPTAPPTPCDLLSVGECLQQPSMGDTAAPHPPPCTDPTTGCPSPETPPPCEQPDMCPLDLPVKLISTDDQLAPAGYVIEQPPSDNPTPMQLEPVMPQTPQDCGCPSCDCSMCSPGDRCQAKHMVANTTKPMLQRKNLTEPNNHEQIRDQVDRKFKVEPNWSGLLLPSEIDESFTPKNSTTQLVEGAETTSFVDSVDAVNKQATRRVINETNSDGGINKGQLSGENAESKNESSKDESSVKNNKGENKSNTEAAEGESDINKGRSSAQLKGGSLAPSGKKQQLKSNNVATKMQNATENEEGQLNQSAAAAGDAKIVNDVFESLHDDDNDDDVIMTSQATEEENSAKRSPPPATNASKGKLIVDDSI